MGSTLQRVLLGRDSFVLVAGPVGGLLAGGLLVVASPSLATAYTLTPTEPLEWVALLALLGLPAILAWVNDGILACWLVDFGPLLSIMLVGSDGAIQTSPSGIYGALVVAAIVSLAWGSIGFATGVGSRWILRVGWTWWLRRTTAGRRSA